jgi:hypothetical protein
VSLCVYLFQEVITVQPTIRCCGYRLSTVKVTLHTVNHNTRTAAQQWVPIFERLGTCLLICFLETAQSVTIRLDTQDFVGTGESRHLQMNLSLRFVQVLFHMYVCFNHKYSLISSVR